MWTSDTEGKGSIEGINAVTTNEYIKKLTSQKIQQENSGVTYQAGQWMFNSDADADTQIKSLKNLYEEYSKLESQIDPEKDKDAYNFIQNFKSFYNQYKDTMDQYDETAQNKATAMLQAYKDNAAYQYQGGSIDDYKEQVKKASGETSDEVIDAFVDGMATANVSGSADLAKKQAKQSAKDTFGDIIESAFSDITGGQDANWEKKFKLIDDSLTDSQLTSFMSKLQGDPSVLTGEDWQEKLKEKIEKFKQENPVTLTVTTDTTALSTADTNKDNIKSVLDDYETAYQKNGGFTEDEAADLVTENPDYLQYLTKVGDVYQLNTSMLEEWNEAQQKQTQELEAAFGEFNSSFFDDYQSKLSEALESTNTLAAAAQEAANGKGSQTAGNSGDHNMNSDAQALTGMAQLGQAVEQASNALENGEISVQEYFDAYDNAYQNNNISGIFGNIDEYTNETQKNVLELASVLQEGLSSGVAQANKQLKNGQMSLTDYNKIMRKATESAEDYQAGLMGLRREGKKFVQISDEEGDGIENLTESQQEFADSCKDTEEAIENSAAADDLNDALTNNYDFLSSFMDDLGNINADID